MTVDCRQAVGMLRFFSGQDRIIIKKNQRKEIEVQSKRGEGKAFWKILLQREVAFSH